MAGLKRVKRWSPSSSGAVPLRSRMRTRAALSRPEAVSDHCGVSDSVFAMNSASVWLRVCASVSDSKSPVASAARVAVNAAGCESCVKRARPKSPLAPTTNWFLRSPSGRFSVSCRPAPKLVWSMVERSLSA